MEDCSLGIKPRVVGFKSKIRGFRYRKYVFGDTKKKGIRANPFAKSSDEDI